jgi:hypothetical protein
MRQHWSGLARMRIQVRRDGRLPLIQGYDMPVKRFSFDF